MTIESLNRRLDEIERNLGVCHADENITWANDLLKEQTKIEEALEILEENGIDAVEQITISNIKWDAPNSADLPKKLVVDITLDNVSLLDDIDGYADNVSDYLSDNYGYCVGNFQTMVHPEPIRTQNLSR